MNCKGFLHPLFVYYGRFVAQARTAGCRISLSIGSKTCLCIDRLVEDVLPTLRIALLHTNCRYQGHRDTINDFGHPRTSVLRIVTDTLLLVKRHDRQIACYTCTLQSHPDPERLAHSSHPYVPLSRLAISSSLVAMCCFS